MQTNGQSKKSSSLNPWIALLASCAIHLSFCIVFALILFTGGGTGNPTIRISFDSQSSESESLTATPIEVQPIESEFQPTTQPDVTLATPARLVNFDGIGNTAAITTSGHLDGDSDVSRAVSMGSVDDGEGERTPKKSRFYGVELQGDRFVFVIDSSRSMSGSRWNSLCEELLRSLKGLSPDQEFFIISFDSEPHPMFGKAPPQGSFLRGDEGSIRRVRSWLNSIILGRNTRPAASLGMAMELKPAAILLLSDGEIMDHSIQELRHYNREQASDGTEKVKIPIHTFLLHSLVGYQTLETIASENDGVFTPVAINR